MVVGFERSALFLKTEVCAGHYTPDNIPKYLGRTPGTVNFALV